MHQFSFLFYRSNILPKNGTTENKSIENKRKIGKTFQGSEGPRRINLNVTMLTTFKMILFIKVQIELEFLPSD